MLHLLYGQVARARRSWYERRPSRRRHLARPVVSVGNLSVGGTGKTPLVAALAGWLVAHGERPAILSRGYARRDRTAEPAVVSDGARLLLDVHAAGDEPLMLARAVPGAVVVVGADRYASGRHAETVLGATVHLLDDGFQHIQLGRDLDIVVTAGRRAGGRSRPAQGPAARAPRRAVAARRCWSWSAPTTGWPRTRPGATACRAPAARAGCWAPGRRPRRRAAAGRARGRAGRHRPAGAVRRRSCRRRDGRSSRARRSAITIGSRPAISSAWRDGRRARAPGARSPPTRTPCGWSRWARCPAPSRACR